MLAAARGAEPSKQAEAQSYAFWVLAELARLDSDIELERRNLEACIAAGAFTAIPHALALHRLETLREQAPPVHVNGKNGARGVVLVEVYEVP